MAKRRSKLEERTQPPSMNNIVDDVENADDDDIVFTILNETEIGPKSPMLNESVFSCDETFSQVESPQLHPNVNPRQDTNDIPDVNAMYSKALQLISLTDSLKSAPEKLRHQNEWLQKSGDELKESIAMLKRESKAVLDSSLTDT